jgi:CheY-like chemotaxis protein
MAEKKKILIVDDDSFLIDIYSRKFVSGGFDVDIALGGEEAIKKIKEKKPDILLLDIVMPGMDGLELLKRLNEEKIGEGIVRVVLSNQSQPLDVEKAAELGVDGYVVKASNTPSEVLAKVMEIIK